MTRTLMCVETFCKYYNQGFSWDDTKDVKKDSEVVESDYPEAESIVVTCPENHKNVLYFKPPALIRHKYVVDGKKPKDDPFNRTV